jgi:class 3 adenylate cyclase
MIDREPEVPEERRIRFRIGVNLGDVIAEEHDIFGDGVNVAARLCGNGSGRILPRIAFNIWTRGESG